MKKALYVFLICALLISGCGKKSLSEQKEIVDNFATAALTYDNDAYEYEQALELIGDYLAGSIDAPEVYKSIGEISDKMRKKDTTKTMLNDDFKALLGRNGITAEEYSMYVNQRAEKLSDYTQNLENIIYFIELYETSGDNEDISFVYKNLSDIESLNRTYEFHSINYWFAEWDGEAVSYIKESVTDKLKVFNNSDAEWTDGRKNVEARLIETLNEIEKISDGYVQYIGRKKVAE